MGTARFDFHKYKQENKCPKRYALSLSSFPIGKKLNTTREEVQRKGHLFSCFCLHGKFTRNSFKTIFQEFRKLVQLLKRKIGILEEHQLQLVSQKGSDFLVLLFTALEASRNIN